MPLTFPAHQLPVLPLKLWKPHWFDATALCVGAASPDLANPLGAWMHRQSHTAIGLVVWAVPFTVMACAVLRWRAAAGVGAQLPDLGTLRLRSYAVLGRRRPALVVTLASALIGAATHVFIDGFTHTGRWGADWANLNTVLATLPAGRELTVAKVLQYTGHTVGSLAAVGVFALIGRQRLLEQWYGADAVSAARGLRVERRQRFAFWLAFSTTVAFVVVTCVVTGRNPIFASLLAAALSLLAAGCLIRPVGA